MTPFNTYLMVVLQTHTLGDSQHWLKKQRFCGVAKSEVTLRCITSLVRTLNHAQKIIPTLNLELVVLDDHSDEFSIERIKKILSFCSFKSQFLSLETRGIMPSILACYRHGYAHGREWVYFAQDDYLYDESAIALMTVAAQDFSKNLGMPASIYPFNDPFRYEPVNAGEKVHIVRSVDRHWRTNYHTASCFMTHIEVIRKNWDLFLAMGTAKVSSSMEDTTINQLFISRGYFLFTPIPSLALHMQFDTEFDPLMDWKSWWTSYGRFFWEESHSGFPPHRSPLDIETQEQL